MEQVNLKGTIENNSVTVGNASINIPIAVLVYEVAKEVESATKLHGPQNSLHESYAVILEELDEFWEEVKVNPKKLSPTDQVKRLTHMRKELIQIAAMCVRAIMDNNL